MAKKIEEIKKDDDIQEKIEQEIKEHIQESDLKKMNIYEKMQEVRIRLQKLKIKKTGWNEYSKFDYFELGDFLPDIMSIFKTLKLFSNFSIEDEKANLTITNAENPQEVILFTSPYVKAILKDKSGNFMKYIKEENNGYKYIRNF